MCNTMSSYYNPSESITQSLKQRIHLDCLPQYPDPRITCSCFSHSCSVLKSFSNSRCAGHPWKIWTRPHRRFFFCHHCRKQLPFYPILTACRPTIHHLDVARHATSASENGSALWKAESLRPSAQPCQEYSGRSCFVPYGQDDCGSTNTNWS